MLSGSDDYNDDQDADGVKPMGTKGQPKRARARVRERGVRGGRSERKSDVRGANPRTRLEA